MGLKSPSPEARAQGHQGQRGLLDNLCGASREPVASVGHPGPLDFDATNQNEKDVNVVQ